jgi:Mg-chelatase subunit ChlD
MAYAWTWDNATSISEVKPLTDKETLKFRNDQAEGKARSQAFTDAAAAAGYIKPTAENSGYIRLKDAAKNLAACIKKDGTKLYTPEEVRAKAEEYTGEKWSDFEKAEDTEDNGDESTEETE